MNSNKTTGKRILEPTYTEGYVHIPHLRQKLKWLYGAHPVVNAQYKLARELRVAPATLSTWLNGMQYADARTVASANPDSIPVKYYRSFLDIWGLPQAVLEMQDLTEFKNTLTTFEAGRSAWERLIRAIPEDDRIEIVVSAARGLIDPDDEQDPGILQLKASDEIMVRVANPGLRHGLMLLQDRFGWSSLRPNLRSRETKLDDVLIFPNQTPNEPRFARLDNVGGIHRLIAIFIEEPLPVAVLDILLTQPLEAGSLNQTAVLFQNRLAAGPNACRMFSRRFLVMASRDP